MVFSNVFSLGAAVLLAAFGPSAGPSTAGPRHPPPGAFALQPPQTFAVDRGVLFINFDGAELNEDGEDSRTNSTLIGWGGTFAGYGLGAKRDAVLQAVKTDWEAFDVMVTDQRPPVGEYVMAMVGPTNFTEGALGIALLDCDDWWTHNNIVYAFHQIDDGYTAAATATTIGQEVAHTFGLEHVDAPSDIMNPYNAGGDPAFSDACLDLLPAPGIGLVCDAQHEAACGPGERQNGHAELLNLFGPNAPDAEHPVARISAPATDTVFPTGTTFVIEATVSDDQGVASVVLLAGDQELAVSTNAPWAWQVNDAPAGTYRFTVRAEDFSGNETTSVGITVYVEDDALPPGAESEGDSDDSSWGSSSGDASDAGGGRPGDGGDEDEDANSGGQESSGASRDSASADDAAWLPGWTGGDERYSSFEGGGCSVGAPLSVPGRTILFFAGVVLLIRRRGGRSAGVVV